MSKQGEKKQRFKDVIHTISYMMGFVWRKNHGKAYVILNYLHSIINAVLSSIGIVLPGLLINALTNEERVLKIAFILTLVLIIPLIHRALGLLLGSLINDVSMKLELAISVDYFNHISSLDYECLENPNIQDQQERAENTLNSITSVVDKTSNLLSAAISLIVITSIISSLNPLIIVLICVIIFINSVMTKSANAKSYEIGKELNRILRIQSFYPFALTNIGYAKEIRVFNLRSYLVNLFAESVEESNAVMRRRFLNQQKLSAFTIITAFIQQAMVYAYCIYNVISKGLPVGTMTIYLSATNQFAAALNAVSQSYLAFSYDSMAVQEMIHFFEIPLKQYETGERIPTFSKNSVIEFRNIYFKYPGSNVYALENFNLTLNGNEKLCIVGENGSGKSTFIKLLTRIYFPEKGEILLDGININEFSYEEYMRLFAPVFQDFATYSLTLKQNIILADSYDEEKLNRVSKNSGIISVVEKSTKGFDVRVDRDKEEDSIQLSGGEAQKMAISRACYHGGEIFLLDEPTAALDPNAEYEIYTQFNDMITDKCAVLITHRLSAVQLADKVAVFNEGHVTEYGTHAELYAKGGMYTEMFDKQAKFYRSDISECEAEQEDMNNR